ncbi:MAG: hydrolase [Myxococcota bacterium]|nr:hydrolase [Myxococcota bacterium]
MRFGLMTGMCVASTIFFLSCGTPIRTQPIRFVEKEPIRVSIDGLDGCGLGGDVVEIDPRTPLVVLVHGCNTSSGRFRTLAGVFEARGQQAICFTYNDRARLAESARRLANAIHDLRHRMKNDKLILLGHSQGGLLTRRALASTNPAKSAASTGFDLHIVTISSPFNGIEASSHCSLIGMHIATLGFSVFLCRSIAGAKWREIHANAAFIRNPGRLGAEVDTYLKIVTDERDTCRVYENGECVEDDYVFSLAEQYNARVDGDPRTQNVEVRAGHVEIVGAVGEVPVKLLKILERQGVLNPVAPSKQHSVARKVKQLYGAF